MIRRKPQINKKNKPKRKKHLNYLRAKLISYASILALLAGFGMIMQENEAGVGLIAIALILGFLNKFVFTVRRTQLDIDAMESVRDR